MTTTYYPYEELKKIPKELWVHMPTFPSSGLGQYTDSYGNVSPAYKAFCSTYDSVAKRRYKTEEAYNYIRDNRHKFSLAALQLGDILEFKELKSKYIRSAKLTRVATSGRVQITSSTYNGLNHMKYFGSKWDAMRKQALEETVSEKVLGKREVKVTKALLHIACHTTALSNELEAFRIKISNCTLSQSDLGDMWFAFEKFNSNNKQWKSHLPKKSKILEEDEE